MEKVTEAVKAIIASPNLITEVTPSSDDERDELYFVYDGATKWSINVNSQGKHYLYFYGETLETTEQLAARSEWTNKDYVFFNPKSFQSPDEAADIFRQLYEIVRSRRFNLDKVLDKILKK